MIELEQPVTHTAMGSELVPCDGRWLNCGEYPELYAAMGDTYTDLTPVYDDDGAICMDNDAVARWFSERGMFRIPDLRPKVVA